MSADFDAMTAAELRRRVAAKDISPVELTKRALTKAEATQPTLNAFFVLLPETALATAKAAEDAVMRGAPLGTDGGGSVRIPCSFTGLAGIKAHFGRVPVWPASATPTLAHVGAIARNFGDAALLISAIGGYDSRDPFSVSATMPDLLGARDAGVAGLRIAFSPTLGYARPDPDVEAIIADAARTFEDLGCKVELVERVFEKDPADLWVAEF